MIAVVALILFGAIGVTARADAPGTTSVNMVPLRGKHRGIVLRSQTVDATIFEDAAGVWADTDIRYRLQNPDTKAITVTVALPGPRALPAGLPDGIEMRVAGEAVELLPGTETAEGGDPILWTRISLPPKRSTDIQITYRQALPEQDGMVVFTYMSAASKDWARAPEGVKVNVRFRTPVEADSILSVAPPPDESETGSMTWQWEGEKNLADIGLVMMAPSWWAAYTAEREKAASAEATASDFVALAERYKNLAQLPLLPFQDVGFFDRFYPSAVSSLEEAVANPQVARSPEAASVFTTLALLYDERARASGGDDRYLYTQLAADVAIRGLATGHADPGLRELASRVLEQALTLAQERNDADAARNYRAQLESLQQGANGLSDDDRERTRVLDEARLALDRKDYRQARQLLAGLIATDAPAAPQVSALLIETSTTPGRRDIRVTSSDGEETGSGPALLQALHAALSKTTGASVNLDAQGLTITIPFIRASEMLAVQHALATRLPELPEAALLRDVLQAKELVFTAGTEPLRTTETYIEEISLQPCREQWLDIAKRLDDAASLMGAPDASASLQVNDTKRLMTSVLRHDAEAWRQLNASSRVVYRLRLSDAYQIEREWSAEPGAARLLTANATRWRDEQVKRAFAGVSAGAVALAGVFTGLTLLISRLIRRP